MDLRREDRLLCGDGDGVYCCWLGLGVMEVVGYGYRYYG